MNLDLCRGVVVPFGVRLVAVWFPWFSRELVF
jgi:hypothetical protein